MVSDFKGCGIYPFNPKEILDYDPLSTNDTDSEITENHSEVQDDTPISSQCNSGITKNSIDVASFTADHEEEILFRKRYTKGYDLHDARYIAWLKVNHPNENCDKFSSLIDHFSHAATPDAVPISSDVTLNTSVTNSITTYK